MFKFFLRTDLRLNPLTTKRGGNETNKPKKKKKRREWEEIFGDDRCLQHCFLMTLWLYTYV